MEQHVPAVPGIVVEPKEVSGTDELSAAVEQFGYKQELKRALSLWDLVWYGMIYAIPIAPFLIFGFVMEASRGMSALSYLLVTVAVLLTANSYGWLAYAFPLSGSAYSYASRGVSRYFGFLGGWAMTLDYFVVPSSLYVFASYAMSTIIPDVPGWVWVICFIIINTVLNIRGIEITAGVNRIFMVFQLAMLGWFLIAVITALINGTNGAVPSTYAFYRPEYWTLGVVMFGAATAFYNYVGIEAVSTLAEETKPGRFGRATVGMGMGLATVFIGIIFVLTAWLGTQMYPNPDEFGDPGTSLYGAALAAGGPALEWAMGLTMALTAGIACTCCCQAATARSWYGMSRDNVLPKPLSKVHPKYKTPWVGILSVGAISMVISVVFSSRGDLLSNTAAFGCLLTYTTVNLACLIYFSFKKRSFKERSRNYLFHGIVPVLAAAFTFYLLWNLHWLAQLVGCIWLGLGIFYLLYLKFIKKVPMDLSSM